jgi:photosystem II stability/assembly factor-like uncharacterized protein
MKKTLLLLSLIAGITFCSNAQTYSVQTLNCGVSVNQNSIFFLNDSVGWVTWQTMSQGGILHTTDGGATWYNRILSPNPIRSAYFSDVDTGYAAGDDGIFKTINGGSTWVNKTSGYFRSVRFTTYDTGYAAGNNSGIGYGISKTIDRGNTWTKVFNKQAADFLFFNNSRIGYAAQIESPYTSFYKTVNGGISWDTINIPGLTHGVASIFYTDTITGYVGEFEHGIYKTTNGGNTWTSLNMGTPFALHAMWFLSSSIGFAVGSGNNSGLILNTSDGGNTWNILYNDGNPSSVYTAVDFPERCTGYVSNNLGIMLKVTCTVTGLNTYNDINKFNVYPNPAIDMISIVCTESREIKIQVNNMVGECVLQKKLINGTNNIDISSLSKGIYVIKLIGTNWTGQKELIKE